MKLPKNFGLKKELTHIYRLLTEYEFKECSINVGVIGKTIIINVCKVGKEEKLIIQFNDTETLFYGYYKVENISDRLIKLDYDIDNLIEEKLEYDIIFIVKSMIELFLNEEDFSKLFK